jgi:hypothetical protein
MNRILNIAKWTCAGLLLFIAIALWTCLWLIPLNLAISKKNLGHRCVEALNAGDIHRYVPETRNTIPASANDISYQSHWTKGFELEGTQLLQYGLSDEDFNAAVTSAGNLIKITSPTTFEEFDTIVSDGWYRRDERNGYNELIVLDQSRKQVCRYLKRF